MAMPALNYRLPGDKLGGVAAFLRPRPRQRQPAYPVAYRLPEHQDVTLSEESRALVRLRDMQRWTGWSNRQLGAILNVSHPTVAAILGGRSELLARSPAVRLRLEEAHQVVQRVHLLAGRDHGRTAEALKQPAFRGAAAIEHLSAGRADDAYLAALYSLRPPRTGRLMVGRRPLNPGDAAVAIHDED
jgi:hypothetical protein